MSTTSVPVPSLEGPLMERFREAGDFHALLLLADHLAELGIRPTFEQLLRRVGAAQQEPAWFMYRHFSWNPLTESEGEGLLRMAVRHAEAEAWFRSRPENEVIWEVDDYADRSWMDGDDGRPLFACSLQLFIDPWNRLWRDGASGLGVTSECCASCCNIDLGPDGVDKDYARVMEAELALEAMPDLSTPMEVAVCLDGQRPTWQRVYSLEEASRYVMLWSLYGGHIPDGDNEYPDPLGMSNWGRGCGNVRIPGRKRPFAHVSYNGRIWRGDYKTFPSPEWVGGKWVAR